MRDGNVLVALMGLTAIVTLGSVALARPGGPWSREPTSAIIMEESLLGHADTGTQWAVETGVPSDACAERLLDFPNGEHVWFRCEQEPDHG